MSNNTETNANRAIDDNRIHYIHNVKYSLIVSGGNAFRHRRCAIGYRIDGIDENDGITVTVADAVCRDSVDNYSRASARSIIDSRITSRKTAVRRRYTFRIPHVTQLPTTSEEWRELDHSVIKAVQYHNNAQKNEKNAIFLSGYNRVAEVMDNVSM